MNAGRSEVCFLSKQLINEQQACSEGSAGIRGHELTWDIGDTELPLNTAVMHSGLYGIQ